MAKNKRKKIILNYLLISFGILMYTFAWSTFLIPQKIIGGGVSGISSVIYYLTDQVLPVGVLNLIINAALVLIALRILGARFGVNTIFGILISSFFFILFQQVIHIEQIIDVSNFDPFMCAVIGGGLSGAGIGLAFSMGGNSGGTDIIAMIAMKYMNVSPGRVIMLLDIFIIASSISISGNVENLVYGYIQMGVMSYALDLVLEGSKQSYQIMVFSQYTKEIADRIGEQVGRGVTLLNAYGWYSKKDQNVLLVIARKTDRQEIMHIINEMDTKAFISVAKVQGVYGQNFDRLKM